MNAPKLLPKPAVALAYGEPWRANRGTLVCDQHALRAIGGRELGNRAYYGGTLIAESGDTNLMGRAADCVNFCAGVEFQPGFAYVGGLADVLDALEELHARLPEPLYPSFRAEERAYNELYADVDAILRLFGRDSFARAKRREAESA